MDALPAAFYGRATIEVIRSLKSARLGEIVEVGAKGRPTLVWVRVEVTRFGICRSGGWSYGLSSGASSWAPRGNVRNFCSLS